jgi:hypothetical protein
MYNISIFKRLFNQCPPGKKLFPDEYLGTQRSAPVPPWLYATAEALRKG